MSKKNRRTTEKEDEKGWSAPIWVAVVTGIVTIVVAIIGLIGNLFGIWVTIKPTVTPQSFQYTPLSPTATNVITDTQTPELISIEPIQTPSEAYETATSPTGIMYVILTANQTSGRAPLTVKLDARTSYLRAPDGTIFECSKGACSYTWYVYFNGVQFTEPLETRGNVDFKFDKRGTYFVSVYICHGAENPICASGGTVIVVE
jgi:hypothetical protein